MIVTFVGHSYVRDFKNYCQTNNTNKLVINSTNIYLKFVYLPGGCFSHFIRSKRLLDELIETKPDIIVTLLGGNDIKSNIELVKVKEDCTDFFNLLNTNLPNTYIIASQVESRFLLKENRHGTPDLNLFYFLSNNFNNWLRNKKFKNRLLYIRGAGRLCNPAYYKTDKIHLNTIGIAKLFDLTKSVIFDTVLNKL